MKPSATVLLKRGVVRPGHPWVYKSQIKGISGTPAPGDVVRVNSEDGDGVGYYNPASEIAVRYLSRRSTPIDAAFVRARIEKARLFREKHVRDADAYRLVSSEADGLPGLIVDRYGDVLVVQFLTLGMERLRPLVLDALDAMPSKGIFERSDSSSRRLEGLPEKTGWIRRDCGDAVTVREGKIRYGVRFDEGHKTGLYLDQRDNRLVLAADGAPGEALDVFCYEGGFGLHLAAAGWKVTGVDSQEDVIRRAESNRKLNGIPEERLSFRTANAFDELKALDKAGAKFDLVILDPPSFVKKKAALEGALAGYKEILLRAMKIVHEGGRVAVFSCSWHVDDNLLMQSSLAAALDTRKSLRVLRFFKQAADHPIDPFVPETYYLKGFLFEVSAA